MKNKEKGSVTVIVITTVFFLLIILGTIFTTMSFKRKSQLAELEQLKQVYDGDMEEIYESRKNRITILDTSSTPIDIENVANYYGHEVSYNGKNYQLFYVDTVGKYSDGIAGLWLQLKTPISDYTPNTNYNTTLISDPNSVLWQVNPNLDSKYGTTLRGLNSWDNNLKAVAGLCNTSYWNTYGQTGTNTYISSTDSGAYIIGGVSAEMFCDSYNEYKKRTSTEPSYFDAQAFNKNSTYGYFYKPKHSNATSNNAEGNYGCFTDYTNYQIQSTEASGMYRYNSSVYTWLSSPSAVENDRVCQASGYYGTLDCNRVTAPLSLRLAVFLPSNIQIQLTN